MIRIPIEQLKITQAMTRSVALATFDKYLKTIGVDVGYMTQMYAYIPQPVDISDPSTQAIMIRAWDTHLLNLLRRSCNMYAAFKAFKMQLGGIVGITDWLKIMREKINEGVCPTGYQQFFFGLAEPYRATDYFDVMQGPFLDWLETTIKEFEKDIEQLKILGDTNDCSLLLADSKR